LPACPTGAITFEQREAAAFDAEAVKAKMAERKQNQEPLPCGCPGSQSRTLGNRNVENVSDKLYQEQPVLRSQLQQWPVQIKLVPVNAPYFNNANLLIAADCVAFAYGNFHNEFMKNKITIIGCPKLDSGDYTEKLTAILAENNIKSVTVARMEVPCCGGIEHSVKQALMNCGKMIPWQVLTISTDGEILD
jgi:hypothetical protein